MLAPKELKQFVDLLTDLLPSLPLLCFLHPNPCHIPPLPYPASPCSLLPEPPSFLSLWPSSDQHMRLVVLELPHRDAQLWEPGMALLMSSAQALHSTLLIAQETKGLLSKLV